MKLEAIILIAFTLICVLSLLSIPKEKWVQSQFIFLFVQQPTWLLGLTVVELGLLEYPYREFGTVNRTSFVFEFLMLPIICVHMNNRFPRYASTYKKLAIYLGISAGITGIEYLLERNTNVINYTGWEWYWTLLSVWFILWLSRLATIWFFRHTNRVNL